MRKLIARLYRGLISQRDFKYRLSEMDYGRATADSIQDSVKFKVEPYSEKTPYRQWIASEGVPIHVGYHMSNVRTLPLGTWQRLGVQGAHVVLEGAEGTDSAYIIELPAGGRTKAQRYLFEEVIYVLEGEGETTVWHDGKNKHTFRWTKGSLFSPPLNVYALLLASRRMSSSSRRYFRRTARSSRVSLQVSKMARTFCSTVNFRKTEGSCVR